MRQLNRILITFVIILTMAFSAYSRNNGIQINGNKLIAPESESYQWYYNNEVLAGENQQNLSVNESGTYIVEFTDVDGSVQAQTIAVEVSEGKVRRIIILGDSTASYYATDLFPRTGWGQVLQKFFNEDSVVVNNFALSGRSSKSYFTDANGWLAAIGQIREGDFVFIQFGHNDQKSEDPARYTEPFTTYKEYLSIYIDTALARGAYPVLLTSVERCGWTDGLIKDSHGDYPKAMKELAGEKGIPLIDMQAKTTARWNALGQSYVTKNIYMNLPAGVYKEYPNGNSDNTHFQLEGAWENCKMVCNGIAEQKDTTTLGLLNPHTQKAGYIKVMPQPNLSGTFTGGGVLHQVSATTIIPTAAKGYGFSHWEIGGEKISDSAECTLDVVDTVVNLIGVFDAYYTINLSAFPEVGGIVTGADSYKDGTQLTVYASANEGYEFVNWTENDSIIGTDTAYQVTISGSNITYVANFQEVVNSITNNAGLTFKLFPNPASHIINVQSEERILEFSLIDMNGKVVYISAPNKKEFQINIERFKPGVYLSNLKTLSGVVTSKILIYDKTK